MAEQMSGELAKIITQMEKTRASVLVGADRKSLSDLFADDLIYGHSSGLVDNKVEYIDKIMSGEIRYQSVEPLIETVAALGEHGAVVTGRLNIEAVISGQQRSLRSRYVAVWRREGDKWRFLAHQSAPRPV